MITRCLSFGSGGSAGLDTARLKGIAIGRLNGFDVFRSGFFPEWRASQLSNALLVSTDIAISSIVKNIESTNSNVPQERSNYVKSV